MSDLHIYVEIIDNESLDAAINRTYSLIDQNFGVYGYAIHEIGKNEDVENEIKALLTVDAPNEKIYELPNELCYQLY